LPANSSASYAQLRAGVKAKADFSGFDQNEYQAPPVSASAGPGHSKLTMGTSQFIYSTKEFSGNRPVSLSKATRTSVYGGGMDDPTPSPANPRGN